MDLDRLGTYWIYEPREDISYHRILPRHNFCPGSRGYWAETNAARSGAVVHFRHRNEFAYPVNTRSKSAAVETILSWAKSNGIVGAGRWGTWEHMNSDIAVAEALKLASNLLARRAS